MPNVPTPRTWVDGEIPPYTTMRQEINETMAWLLQPPTVKLRLTAAQSVANATYVAVSWNVEDYDPYNWHGTVNPTRITPTYPGWYRGWFAAGFAAGTAGNYRLAVLTKNGAQIRRRDNKPPATAGHNRRTLLPFFVAMNGTTDYLETLVYQDNGAAMTLPTTGPGTPEFFLRWWGTL